MGTVLFFVGLIIGAISGLWILVLAFREGAMWGLACLLVPLVSLIFCLTHLTEAKIPLLMQIAAVVLIISGVVMSPELAEDYGLFAPTWQTWVSLARIG